MKDAALVQATGMALGYGQRRVLSQVDWEVRPGQYWFVLGPNGQGKSTLLRALLGLLAPLEGQLRLDPRLDDRMRVSFVPQRCDLNPTLPTTVREFVSHGFVGLRLPAGERERRLAAALEQVSLPGFARRSFWSLSGGQRQRALLARALVREPLLLVLDEPTSGLDLTSEDQLMQTLAQLHRSAMTLVLVTHDLAMAARHATHVAVVHDGRVQSGERDALMTSKILSRAYAVPMDVLREQDGRLSIVMGGEASP